MPTQSEYEKVKLCIIEPMREFYDCKVSAAQAEAFVEELGQFGEQVLKEAWKRVRRESKYPPKLAHFYEVCKSTPTQTGSLPAYQPKKPAVDLDRLMFSEIGQKALREGVACSFAVMAAEGRSDFTEADIRRQKAAWREGVDMLVKMPEGPLKQMLGKMHDAIRDRQLALERKYLRAP